MDGPASLTKVARPGSRITWAAIGLAGAVTVPYLVIFAQTIRGMVAPESVSEALLRDLALMGAGSQGD